jgi:hypothetical protein
LDHRVYVYREIGTCGPSNIYNSNLMHTILLVYFLMIAIIIISPLSITFEISNFSNIMEDRTQHGYPILIKPLSPKKRIYGVKLSNANFDIK